MGKSDDRYRYEIAMEPQPEAVSLATLRGWLESGKLPPYTLIWAETESEPVYRLLGPYLADLKAKEREKIRRQTFVPMAEKPILRAGEKPAEFFQKKTRAELYHEAMRYVAERQAKEGF